MNNKDFFRAMLKLALPIAVQNLLASCAYLVDTAMVVKLGNVATSGIGVATRWSFLMNIVVFGVCSGVSAFTAQYWGAGEERNIRRTTGIGMIFALVIASVYALAGRFAPEIMMSVFTNEAAVIAAGGKYLRIACLAPVFSSVAFVISSVNRSTEDVMTPFFASACSVVVNTVLNYGLIYGRLGLPEMGLEGAAVATVIAMAVNLGIMVIITYCKKGVLARSMNEIFSLDVAFVRKFAAVSAPVLMNEIFWAGGTNAYSMILARQGSESYSAFTVFTSIHEVFFVFFIGLCHACAIMVGKAIGEGEIEKGYQTARKFMIITPLIGVAVGLLQVLVRTPLLGLLSIETEEARQIVSRLLLIYALILPLYNLPYISVVGIFRAGGDTRFGFYIDTLSVYLLGLPTLFLLAKYTEMSFTQLVTAMYIAEYAPKTVVCVVRFASRRWIRRLV